MTIHLQGDEHGNLYIVPPQQHSTSSPPVQIVITPILNETPRTLLTKEVDESRASFPLSKLGFVLGQGQISGRNVIGTPIAKLISLANHTFGHIGKAISDNAASAKSAITVMCSAARGLLDSAIASTLRAKADEDPDDFMAMLKKNPNITFEEIPREYLGPVPKGFLE